MFPYFIARKWLGGRNVDEAVRYAQELDQRKILPLIDYVGEHYHSIDRVEDSVEHYIQLVDQLDQKKICACLSLKLSQFGLDLDEEICVEHFKTVLAHANEKNIFVWMDMESSKYTEKTIAIFEDELNDFEKIGLTLQANLKRTEEDLHRLVKDGATIRLVKGAYSEATDAAFQTKEEVEEKYGNYLEYLFDHTNYFSLATHDQKFIRYGTQLLNAEQNQGKIEFQLLKGIKPKLEKELVKQGLKVAEYFPFGNNYSPYVWRRIKELERNLF